VGSKRFLGCLNGRVRGLFVACLNCYYDFSGRTFFDVKSFGNISARPAVLGDFWNRLKDSCREICHSHVATTVFLGDFTVTEVPWEEEQGNSLRRELIKVT